MKKKLVITADLGRMRTYQVEEETGQRRPRLRLIEDRITPVTYHVTEIVTDNIGRYRKEPSVIGAQSDGEEHNLELQRRRQALRGLAEAVAELVDNEVEEWHFAADARINQALLDELTPEVRRKLHKNIRANLSKSQPDELRERFEEVPANYASGSQQP
jgi:hypothetical protein